MGSSKSKVRVASRNGGSKCQLSNTFRPSLSQLDCLYTTVPINVNPPQLSGRHTPTRRSMERSRIIHSNSAGRRRPRMRYYRFLVILVAIQIMVGLSLASVAIYTSTVTPSLRIRDLPHWAGIPLTVSGLVGLIFVTRCYGDYKDDTATNVSKLINMALVLIAIILCGCAVVFLTLHMITFATFNNCSDGPYPALPPESESEDAFGALDHSSTDQTSSTSEDLVQSDYISCTCRVDVGGDLKRLFVYELISCSDVLALVKFLFIVMSILGCVGFLDGAIYIFMLWSFRYKDIYVGPRNSNMEGEPSPSRSST
ncbi:hypothetical protein CHUAL_009765 [Chamberlinius hualienensis]